MRIDSSQLLLTGSHQAVTRHERKEQLTLSEVSINPHTGTQDVKTTTLSRAQRSESHALLTYTDIRRQNQPAQLEQQARRAETQAESGSATTATDSVTTHEASDDALLQLSPEERLRAIIIASLVKRITGREMELQLFDQRQLKTTVTNQPTPANTEVETGLAMEYQVQETFYQRETTRFEMQGQVRTADGKQLDIRLSVNMDRELLQHSHFSMRAGAALVDPLIISFDGRAAELTEQRFEFDLTVDGKNEWLPGLGAHSAFLALDRNGDGRINDGSELFGARTGDGFAELSAYDDDGNGWIDANDAVFDQLLLWMRPGDGSTQQLIRLSDAGIGAIYLGSADTPFHLHAPSDQSLLGVVRSSGIYLKEDGQAGLIQHVDLSV